MSLWDLVRNYPGKAWPVVRNWASEHLSLEIEKISEFTFWAQLLYQLWISFFRLSLYFIFNNILWDIAKYSAKLTYNVFKVAPSINPVILTIIVVNVVQ